MLSFTFNTFSINWLFTDTSYLGTFRDDYVFSFTGRGDTIDTGAGDDYIVSGRGRDIITAGVGDDIVYAGNGRDEVDGGDGNDFIDGGRGADILNGGAGEDIIFGGRGNDQIDGGAGNDFIDGGRGRDIIRGGAGDDEINGGRGRDTIIYTASEDAGNDIVNGGQGQDILVLELTAAQLANIDVQADLAAYEAYVAGGSNGSYSFTTIGLTVTGGFEALELVDLGGPVDPDPNTAPVANGPVTLDAVDEDQASIISSAALLAAISDAEGDALSISSVEVSSGSISVTESGDYEFIPDDNFNGPVTLTYTVTDGEFTVSNTADLTVNLVNDAVVIDADATTSDVSGEEDGDPITGQVVASDIDGDTLIYSVSSDASGGAATIDANGAFSYVAAPNFNGPDEFTVTIDDGNGGAVTQVISVTVTAVNDGPAVGAPVDLGNIDEDTNTAIPLSALLANASDIDGDALSIVAESITADNASVSFGDEGLVLTPDSNFFGEVVLSYEISDGLETVQSTASLTVDPVNDAPAFEVGESDTSVTGDEDAGPILGTVIATDVDGDQVTYGFPGVEMLISTTFTDSGVVTVDQQTGAYSYIPDPNFNGTDTFTVVARDPSGATSEIEVSVEVAPVNDAPDIIEEESNLLLLASPTFNDEVGPSSGSIAFGTIAAEDIDVGDTLTFSIDGNGQTEFGEVSINSETGDYVYETELGGGPIIIEPPQFLVVNDDRNEGPIEVFPGGPGSLVTDTFDVIVTDSGGLTDTVNVQIDIPTNDGPGPNVPTEDDDFLFGTPGNDEIDGLGGNDTIEGFTGDDTLTGGAGFDSFVYFLYDPDLGSDTITDFTKGEDRIQVVFDDVGVNQILNSQQANDDGTFTYSIGPAEWTVGVELDANDIFIDFGFPIVG